MKPFSNNWQHFFLFRLPVIALCVLIFWQSSFPGVISRPLFAHDDKVLHFTVYALLAFLNTRCLIREKKEWPLAKAGITAMVFAIFFGLSDEIHQAFVPARDASTMDFLADALGSVAGTLLHAGLVAKKRLF